jgi:trigger factor
MKVNIRVEKLDDVNYLVSGTVPNNTIEEKVKALKQSAPKDSQEQLSDEKIEQQAAEQAFREFLDGAVEEANLDVETLLGQPGLKKYEKRADEVYFEVELATAPEFSIEGIDFTDIIPEFTKPKADEKLVEEKLKEFANQQAPFKAIKTPRAVENNDVTVIDFEGFIDGVAFEGGKAEKFNLKIGSNSFIPGFEPQLIGMKYGEEKTINVTFPKEYQGGDLAGKEAQFKIKLHEIQEQKADEINDDFAKRILNDENVTLDDLKEKFADQISAQEISHIYMTELKPKIVEGLLSKVDFTLPNNIVEQEIAAKVSEKLQFFPEQQQKDVLADKNKFFQLRESVREEARASIKKALIVEAIAKKEGITADEQEAISALTYQAMMSGQDATQLVNHYKDNNMMHSVILALIEDKLFGQMLGINKQ